MIRMIPSGGADEAKKYFDDALSKSDYYTNDQELAGTIHGRLAQRLGITGPASRDVFFALCDNKNPVTGETLTQRHRDDRITGYDINFHVPKSVSILHALSEDQRILDVFQKSVRETMEEIEADTKTRVRKNGKQQDRDTGELIYGEFIHQTARPVEGNVPDPHLHAHMFVFNATYDAEENRIKAGKFRDIKRSMPYYQARYHKRLADKLTNLGYGVRRTNTAFELEGVSQKVINHFSKRTDEIGRVAKEKGITDAKELDGLGAKTRAKKQKGHSMQELKAEWRKQIDEVMKDADKEDEPPRSSINKEKLDAGKCVDFALKHCFERASVMEDRKLQAAAYRFAIGDASTSIVDIDNEVELDDRLLRIRQGGQTLCTTKDVLTEEKRTVELARAGRGMLQALYKEAPAMPLDGQQKRAAEDILTNKNLVSIISGKAGAGKTTLLKSLVTEIEKTGKGVFVVAPTSEASRGVLRKEGFTDAETVAKFLGDKKNHDKLQNNVLIVDEAGLLGTGETIALLELATKHNTRLVLLGDTRQHSAVQRGDALRILNTVGGIEASQVSKIYRQKRDDYRSAVEDLSVGRAGQGFQKLDDMGAIKEADPLSLTDQLVDDYVATLKAGKTGLVISPTHKQGNEVTEKIRQRLRDEKLIGEDDILISRLANLNLTEAERSDWRSFKQGLVVKFNQNTPGIKRGSAWTVKDATDGNVTLENHDGETVHLPKERPQHFDVFREDKIALAKGDTVRITKNGLDQDNKDLNNGTTLDVIDLDDNGAILLKSKISEATYRIDKDYGHITHAHCITSNASQGKTVDEVFIAQPAATFGATHLKQFYVSVSRGRDAVHIYTDDKEALLEQASKSGDRQSAMELLAHHEQEIIRRNQAIEAKQQAQPSFNNHPFAKPEPPLNHRRNKEYEPGI